MTPAASIRAAILGSSGGSALRAAVSCLQRAGTEVSLLVITDRDCGLHDWAREAKHAALRVPFTTRAEFSMRVAEVMRAEAQGDLLLFYTRLISAPLIEQVRVCNIHPSLLPAFPGMHGVANAVAAGARLLGATLHGVDAGMDTGPIHAQVACALPPQVTLARANRLSYLQRAWLTLVWFDRLAHGESARALAEQRSLGAGVGVSSAGLMDTALRDAYIEWVAELEAPDEHVALSQHDASSLASVA